jgi:hypothetical protein
MIKRLLIAALLALAPSLAWAQASLLQGGTWNGGHVPMYTVPGGSQSVVQDSGSAAGGAIGTGLSELGITIRGTGTPPYANTGTGPYNTDFCNYDGPTTGQYHYLCMSPNAQGGPLIAFGAGGGATALPLTFNYNGTLYPFPFTVGGVVGPGSTTSGDAACWNNTVGSLLKDCGVSITSGTTNDLVYYSASGAMSALATANSSVLVTSGAGVPSLSTTLPATLTIPSPTLSSPTLSGTVAGSNTIPLSILQQQSAYTLLANATSGTANVTAITINQLPGVTTNTAANAGNIGELISSTVLFGSAVSLSTGSPSNITSISLTAGDWDVSGVVCFGSASGTTFTQTVGAFNTSSAALPTPPAGGFATWQGSITGTDGNACIATGTAQELLSTTTTIYLIGQGTFTGSTLVGYGYIGARRRR